MDNTLYIENAFVKDIEQVTGFVEAKLEEIDCPMKVTMQISIAIDEIFSNIVKYGYKEQGGPVWVSVIPGNNSVSVKFEDMGPKYNPLEREDPDTTLSAEDRSIGGLGIFVVKKTMSDVNYQYADNKNILTIRKDF